MRPALLFFFLSVLSSSLVFGAPAPVITLHHVEAEHVDFDEKVLHLVGNVRVDHDFGTMTCQESTILLRPEKKNGESLPFDHIFLKGSVCIDFSDGSQLCSDEGVIDCEALEGTFTSNEPSKVVYTTFTSNGTTRVPVKASSRALHAKIAKTPEGFSLRQLQGEGAVNIEYMRPNIQSEANR